MKNIFTDISQYPTGKHEIKCYLRILLVLLKKNILGQSKFKGFADDKINVTQKLKFVLERVENIVGKGENAVYEHFLLYPQCFQRTLSLRVVKSKDCVVKS